MPPSLLLILAAGLPPADIVVTGRGLANPLGDAAYDVVTIDRARLTGSASGWIEDILRDAAGFAQFRRSDSRSAQPTSQGATLRGLGGNASSRALVLLDGVPQTDPFGGWLSWAALVPERLGQVRVTRGGGSGAFGPGALAGTIELSSAGPEELAPLWGKLAYGSRDSLDAGLGVSGKLAGGFASLSGSYARGDGFIPIVASQRGPVDFPARYRQYSVAGHVVAPLGGDVELQANGLAFHDARTRGVPFTPNRTNGADASLQLIGRGPWGWQALAYLQTRDFSSGFASLDAARITATETLDQYKVPGTGVGGKLELRPPLGEGIELRLGADTRITDGRTKERYQFVAGVPTRGRVAGGRTETFGAFAEASATPIERLTLTGGARIDRWRIEDGRLRERTLATGALLTDTAFPDRDGWRPTARAGIAYRPAGAITLRGAGYLGWRLPTLNELYRPFRVGADATAANAGLDPERLRGADVGIDYRPFPQFRASATLFTNRLEDAITNVTLARGPGVFPGVGFVSAAGFYRQRQNLDAVASRGIELDGRLALRRWSFAASYALTDAKVRSSGAAATLDGLRPAQTARQQASATLGWERPAGEKAMLTLHYVGPQYEDDQNSAKLDDAVTLDASVAVPLGRGLSIEAGAENLANARVEAGISGGTLIERATPRTLWLGVRYGG